MHHLINRSLLLLLTFTTSSLAQNFNVLAGAPSCAQSCSTLTQAQASCNQLYPGGQIASVAACFCTTPNVATLGSNAAGVCSNCANDVTAVEQWFGAYCAAPATITAVQAPSTVTAAAGGDTTVGGTTATTTQVEASATNSLGIFVPVQPQSYWSAHGRWIVMVIVLVVAFSIIIAVGVILKKRYNKKHNAASQLPPGSIWGPSHRSHPDLAQPSHSSLAVGARVGGNDAEKGSQVVSDFQTPDANASILGNGGYGEEKTQEGKGRKLKKLVGR